MTNNVISAHEYFVSQIILKKIICARDALEADQNKKSNIIVFTPTAEFHEIPLLVRNYFYRAYNKLSTYFGVNVSPGLLKILCTTSAGQYFVYPCNK